MNLETWPMSYISRYAASGGTPALPRKAFEYGSKKAIHCLSLWAIMAIEGLLPMAVLGL
jgi:hypothetical protein